MLVSREHADVEDATVRQEHRGIRLRAPEAAGRPRALDLGDVPTTRAATGEGVIVFVTTIEELRKREAGIVAAARECLVSSVVTVPPRR